MTLELSRFTNTRPTAVAWLSSIPQHWREQTIKRLFRQAKRQGYPNREVLSVYREFGVIRKSSRDDNHNKTPENLALYQRVDVGDLVINKMKSWQGSLGVSLYDGITSPDYIVYTPAHDESGRFIHYLLRAEPMPAVYRSISNGIRPSQWRLEPEKFEGIVVPLPPREEQTQIAKFLDYETARIDALIDKQQQLIELLKEKRQAVISHAVTKGLDPKAPMRDSGVEWLGRLPAHWSTPKMAQMLSAIGSGTTPPSGEAQWYEGDIPWVTTGELRETTIHRTAKSITPRARQVFSSLKLHPEGAVVIAMYGATIGRLGLLGVPACTNQACCVLVPSERLEQMFLYYWLQGVRDDLVSLAFGGGQPNISQATISALRLTLPPTAEQLEIVESLDQRLPRLDALLSRAGSQIDLLQERRTALISAAVTGKIDVRNWKAPEAQQEVA